MQKISVEHTKIGWAWPFNTAICFMVPCITSPNFRPIAEIIKKLECHPSDLIQTYHGKFRSYMKHVKIGQAWPPFIEICFMVLCITPPNFRLIPEILQELEGQRCPSGRTDRMDRWLQAMTTIPVNADGGRGNIFNRSSKLRWGS